MPIPITCAACQVKFQAPDDKVGKRGKCPKCFTPFVVPGSSAGMDAGNEPVIIPEMLEAPPAPTVKRVAAKYVEELSPAGQKSGEVKKSSGPKKPNARNKKKVDESDYLTKVNGKPIAFKPGEAPPPGIPRSGRG